MNNNKENIICDTDSYKGAQNLQYPPNTRMMSSHILARRTNIEITFFGLQIFLNEVLSKPFNQADIDEAAEFFDKHVPNVPFPKAGFEHILYKYGGYFPVTIRAVPEGTVVPSGNVLMTVESVDDPECFWIVSWLETQLLRDNWFMPTVATNSRNCKKVIKKYLDISSDNPLAEIMFKLHDFGSRGVSSRQSAEHGGAAHLVNFYGSDTCVGVRCANRNYFIEMAGHSIAASEHSTITSWGLMREINAYSNMIEKFGKKGAVFACVSDSYNIFNACENIWGGELKQKVINSGSIVVIRPDSGKPAETVVKCLQILDKKFGSVMNKKGYKVLNHVRIIQGDGININSIKKICIAVIKAGFSMDNVNFGMGGALLQHLNRDTLGFAMKCGAIMDENGVWIDVYKSPIGDPAKKSIAGRVSLYRVREGHGAGTKFVTLRKEIAETMNNVEDALQTVFVNGRLFNQTTFDEVRKKASL